VVGGYETMNTPLKPTKKNLRSEAVRVFGRVYTETVTYSRDGVMPYRYKASVFLLNFSSETNALSIVSGSDVNEKDAIERMLAVLDLLPSGRGLEPAPKTKAASRTRSGSRGG
jgi:hypothetical protein